MSEPTILNIKLKELPWSALLKSSLDSKYTQKEKTKHAIVSKTIKKPQKNGFRYVKATETEMITYIRKAEKENQPQVEI